MNISFSLEQAILRGSIQPEAAQLTVNGTAVYLSDGSFVLALPPGAISVQVSDSGFRTFSESVTLIPGNTTYLNVTLTPLPSTPVLTSSGGGASGLPVALVVVVVVAIAIVAATAIAALSMRRRARQ